MWSNGVFNLSIMLGQYSGLLFTSKSGFDGSGYSADLPSSTDGAVYVGGRF